MECPDNLRVSEGHRSTLELVMHLLLGASLVVLGITCVVFRRELAQFALNLAGLG